MQSCVVRRQSQVSLTPAPRNELETGAENSITLIPEEPTHL